MIVIDSSVLIAILHREPEADSFLHIIASSDGCLLSSVSLLETSMVLAGRSGDTGSWTNLDALIARAAIQVVAHDAGLADAARQAFLHYGKGRHPAGLNLGDCASYALAKECDLGSAGSQPATGRPAGIVSSSLLLQPSSCDPGK